MNDLKTNDKLKILFVEDVPADRELAEIELRKKGLSFTSEIVESENDYIRALDDFKPDVIISDYSLPSFDGMNALRIAKDKCPTVPFILYTGTLNEETAVDCIKAGAWDYVLKENIVRLTYAVRESLLKSEKEKELQKNKNKYIAIFESTGTATMIVEEDTTITMANNECLKLTGYSSEELIGTKWLNYAAPENLDMLIKYSKNRIENPESSPKKYEAKLINKKGETRYAILDIGIIKGTKEKVVSMLDITELKKGEEELRKSKQNWEGIFNGLSHPTVILDAQHNVIEINESLRNKLGEDDSELKKFKCWNIFHDTDSSCAPSSCPFEQMIQTGKSETAEMELEAFGGHYLINCTPLFDDDGKLEKIIHIATDITDRKQVERELKEIISKNPMSIQIVDRKGYTVNVNAAHTKLFGSVPPPEYSIFDDVQLKKQGFKELFERVQKGEVVHFPDTHFNIHDFDSSYPDMPIWVRGVIFPLIGSNGKPERYVLMQDDITERKKAEEDLYNSHKLLQRIIDLLPVRIFWKDTNLNYLGCNKVFAEDAGMSCSDDLIGKDDFQMGWKDQAANYREDDTRVLKTGESKINFEEIQTTPTGDNIWLKTSKIVLNDLNGKTIGILGSYEDITEQKNMINELIETKNKAEEMSKVKSNFLANMSHEIRTPLNGILGFTDILKSEITNTEHIKYTDIIERSGKRLLDTLNLILTFAKLDAEKQEINYKKVKIDDIIGETIKVYNSLAKSKNLYLKSAYKSKNILVRTDENFMMQILSNLVNNALKYTISGGVTIELSENNNSTVIKVIDTGIGIAKDKHEIIFEEFRQESEGFSRSFEGTGLGLSITKKFVELLKGKIYVESEPGKGSTFVVEFPYESEQETAITKSDKSTPISGKAGSLAGKEKVSSILIVEDDEENRFYIENILKDFDTDYSKDGPGALAKAKEKNYDIILMDINLGKGMDGISVVKELRKTENYKDIPIVALTAYVMNGDKEEFLASGCTHYLGKPFKRVQLLGIINSIIKENK